MRASRHPAAALAAVLLQKLHLTDDHAAVDRLAHVVNGEQGDLHGREGFIQINNLRRSCLWGTPQSAS